MADYTTAEKYSILKLNHYEFKTVGDTVEWGYHHNEGFYWGGKCADMNTAIAKAFEEWEKGV